jgi:SNF2 family DNA or RNA helicase
MSATLDTAVAPAINGELWDHQLAAFRRYAGGQETFLGHDMGTGKGATTIALLEHAQASRVLVVCPKNVMGKNGGAGVWGAQLNGPLADPEDPSKVLLPHGFSPRHWEIWSGRVMGARGPKKNPSVDERAAALIRANTDALKLRAPFCAVVNQEACWQGEMAALTLGTEWDAVIYDESHRLKAPNGKASRHAARIADRVRARGGRVFDLTGTPMPHSPFDIWAQMRIVDGGRRLGTSYTACVKRYGVPEEIRVQGGKQRTVYKRLRGQETGDPELDRNISPIDRERYAEFNRLVGEVLDVVSADDVLDLPKDTDKYLSCKLDPSAAVAYRDLERYGIHEAETGVLTAANAMVELLRLAQVTSGYGKDADTGAIINLTPGKLPNKARELAEFLQDVPIAEPVVVFCRFHQDLDAVRAVAEQQGRTYGELSGRRRDALTDESRLAEGVGLAGVQLKSGGVGIDLTRARLAVYYSQDFTLSDYRQSRRRLVRPGQTRPVLFTHILARGTVDHTIYEALSRREEVIDAVLAYLELHTVNGRTTP